MERYSTRVQLIASHLASQGIAPDRPFKKTEAFVTVAVKAVRQSVS